MFPWSFQALLLSFTALLSYAAFFFLFSQVNIYLDFFR